jgi:hypothetical protein
MGLIETFQSLTSAEAKPDFLENIVVGSTLILYIIYLIFILTTGNSRVFSFSTLIITIGAVIVICLKETMGNMRGWILVQCAILFGIVGYICMHKWNNRIGKL